MLFDVLILRRDSIFQVETNNTYALQKARFSIRQILTFKLQQGKRDDRGQTRMGFPNFFSNFVLF